MIFKRVPTGLVFVLRLNTILGFQYRASTRPRLQTFKTQLENESRVSTPIRQNLMNKELQSISFQLILYPPNLHVTFNKILSKVQGRGAAGWSAAYGPCASLLLAAHPRWEKKVTFFSLNGISQKQGCQIDKKCCTGMMPSTLHDFWHAHQPDRWTGSRSTDF